MLNCIHEENKLHFFRRIHVVIIKVLKIRTDLLMYAKYMIYPPLPVHVI